MEDFRYKEYSEEENRIYNETIPKILEGLKRGTSFQDACDTIKLEDNELKKFIEDDALKIVIAELHYLQGFSLPEVAETIRIKLEIIDRANTEMLEDIETSTSEIFRLNNPDIRSGSA